MEAEEGPDSVPLYWDRLTDDDKHAYLFLKKTLASPTCKNRRNRSTETFQDIINGLKAFVVRNDQNDRNRMLVCGICWLPNQAIAINTRQLRLILSKCKSSINGSFQQLGYGTVPTGTDSAAVLIKIFPELENNYPELRQWTVRQLLSATPTPLKLQQLIQMNFMNREFLTPPPNFAAQQNSGVSIGSSANSGMNQQTNDISQMTLSAPPQMFDTIIPTPAQNPISQIESMTSEQQEAIQPTDNETVFDNDDLANFLWDSDNQESMF